MKSTHRMFSEDAGDFRRLCRFMTDWPTDSRECAWCIGRMVDWKYGLFPGRRAVASFWDKNARLWFDGFDELAGFVISENGGADFHLVTRRGFRMFSEEMLQWVLSQWGGRGNLNTEVGETNAMDIALLERNGFRRRSAFYSRRFDLTKELAPRVPLEQGFTIVDMHSHPDRRAQRLMRADGFSDCTSLTEDELRHQLEFYNHAQEGPIYHPQVDLCVMAPDGTLVAGCEGLIDARNQEADVERVCTRSAYRRRGFARAVIQECLYRLRDLGMQQAYITGYSPEALALYGSLGHTEESRWFIYEKPADAPPAD